MRPKSLCLTGHTAIIDVSILLVLFLVSMTLSAQTLTDFSGKWEFDKARSSPGKLDSEFEGTLTRHITQNPSVITYRDIYARIGSKEWSTTDESFNLNGKEKIKKEGVNSRTWAAKWSVDKKVLTLTYAETYVEEGVSRKLLMADSYALSDGGKTLTIETYSKNHVTGETKTKSVYHEK